MAENSCESAANQIQQREQNTEEIPYKKSPMGLQFLPVHTVSLDIPYSHQKFAQFFYTSPQQNGLPRNV